MHFFVAEWSKTLLNISLVYEGSNPIQEFCFFLQFSQTLRANYGFQRSLAIEWTCLSFYVGSKLLIHVIKHHGILRHL